MRDWKLAVEEVSKDGRLVQRSFWRAFRRNAEGDVDEDLILKEWYNSDSEEETVEELEGDVEED